MVKELLAFSAITLLGVVLLLSRHRGSAFWREHWWLPARFRDDDETLPGFVAGPVLLIVMGLLAITDIIVGSLRD